MSNLSDRLTLITGASSGIGRSCARAFAAAGSRLIICARRGDRIEELADELCATGASVLPLQLDVRDYGSVVRTLDGLPSDWSDVEILVNNAGLSRGLDPIQDGSIQDWEEMIDTNIKGLLYVTRTLLPGMVRRGVGHVINIGSIAGHEVYPKGNVYCASKHAVAALTKGMQIDLNGTGVKVTTVDPGLVETEFSMVRFRGDSERAANVYKGLTPLTPDDVADAIVYCATRPRSVNVHELILMPADQATATIAHRRAEG